MKYVITNVINLTYIFVEVQRFNT